jgi:hypothetical protein
MLQSRVEVGIHVTISHDISNTHKAHGTDRYMTKMKGNQHIIESVQNSYYGKSVRIRNYTWHPKDLIEASPRKKSNIVNFDIKELIT